MRHSYAITLAALLIASYCYVLPRWADWNQNSRLDLVRALSEQRSVVIDRYVANTGDYALFDGHTYSDKAPGPAFIALPAALLAQQALQLPALTGLIERAARSGALNDTLNPAGSGIQDDKLHAFMLLIVAALAGATIPTILGSFAVYGLARAVSAAHAPALLVTIGYALASTVAVYAGNFYSHALVASLLVGAWQQYVFAYARARALLMGLLLGWAVISEYPAALPAAVIGCCAAWHWRRGAALGWMALGGMPPLLLMGLYDWMAFGTVLPTGYTHSALWQAQHSTGLISLTYPHAEALLGLTIGLFRGLFVRAPWLLLALPGLIIWWRSGARRALWWAALLAPLSTLLVYGSSDMWWGGFAAGPRYVVAAIPFLAVASSAAIGRVWDRAGLRLGAYGLVLISGALTWSEALAQQRFPADTLANPWLEHTLPAWSTGDIARNLGTALGLRGTLSIVPLVVAFACCVACVALCARRPADAEAKADSATL
jgi:hypothetical protein